MIYGKIKELEKHKGYSKNLDCAIDYLLKLDKDALVNGKTEICGNEVFINVMDCETKPYEEGMFEAHKNYIDIQMLLEGKEKIVLTHIEDLEVVEKYDGDRDIMFLKGNGMTECILTEDYVCVCFPNDAHMPGISIGQEERTSAKKLVVKIKVD